MSDEIPGFIFKIQTFIKDLDDPTDMVKEILSSKVSEQTRSYEMNIKIERNQANV